MQRPNSELDAAHLLGHDVYFVFACQPSSKKQDDKATAEFIALSDAIKGHANDIWQDEEWSASKDFLPKAESLFKSSQTLVSALTELGLNFANGGSAQDDGVEAKLTLKLREKASERVGGLVAVPIKIKSLRVFHFPSKMIIGVLQVQYVLDAEWTLAKASQVILECNHFLGHTQTHIKKNCLSWVSTTDKPAPSLMGIVRALLAPARYKPDGAAFKRLFIFSAMLTSAPRIDTADFDLLLSRLARKHTLDYLPGEGYAKAFGLLQHVRCSTMAEGAALLVSSAPGNEFSANYLNNSVPHVYVPAVLINMHEAALLRRMEDSIGRVTKDESATRLKALEHLRHELLQFRLGYRMQTISGISMHNEFHQHLRTALGLDGTLDQFTDDVQLVEQQLAADLREEQERRSRLFTASASALACLISIHEVGDMVVRWRWGDVVAIALSRTFTDETTLEAYKEVLEQQHVDETLWAAATVAIAIIIFVASWFRKLKWPAAE